jgi:DNA-binding PadR family transcriptional regulator
MMRDPVEPRLSLTEWVVLCVAAEKPAHGFATAGQLGRGSALGTVWHVARPQVYRSLERLARLGLIHEVGRERSSTGPIRQLSEVSPAGRELAAAWLRRPTRHGRDIRSELLVKLSLPDRPRPMPVTGCRRSETSSPRSPAATAGGRVVGRLVGQVLFAGEEPDERPSWPAVVAADGAAQHRIVGSSVSRTVRRVTGFATSSWTPPSCEPGRAGGRAGRRGSWQGLVPA